MVLDENVRLCLLNDFYGSLLTQNQQNVLDSYLNFNMQLSEISQNLGITRQAVLDTIKKASKRLEQFENKLGMLKKYLAQQKLAFDYGKTDDDFVKKIIEIWRQD